MKNLILGAALALAVGGMAFASTPELRITSGGSDSGIISGTSFTNTNFAGWNVTVSAQTHSPSLTPVGMDLGTIAAECLNATCADLVVQFTDNGYTALVNSLTQSITANNVGTTSTTQMAWSDNTNTLFGHGTPLGTIGPLPDSFVKTSLTTNVSPTIPFSLTIQDTLAGCTGCSVQYSLDANITGTPIPEPASVALFGGILALCASRLRRRKA
jgi:hypothetical protein